MKKKFGFHIVKEKKDPTEEIADDNCNMPHGHNADSNSSCHDVDIISCEARQDVRQYLEYNHKNHISIHPADCIVYLEFF